MKRRKTSSKTPEREKLERQLEALQRDVRQLQLEHDLLKKANELLKKGLGVDLQILSNREKTQLVDALGTIYRVPELLAQMAWRGASTSTTRSVWAWQTNMSPSAAA